MRLATMRAAWRWWAWDYDVPGPWCGPGSCICAYPAWYYDQRDLVDEVVDGVPMDVC